MKKNKGTLFFFIFVMIIVSWAFYEHSYSKKEAQEATQQDVLLKSFHWQDLVGVTLTQRSDLVAFEKQENKKELYQWRVVEPFKDEVDLLQWRGFLQDLFSAPAQLLEVDSKKASQYGFTGQLKIQLRFSNKDIEEVVIGEQKAFDGSTYLEFKRQYYIGDSRWRSWVFQSGQNMRNKKVFPSSQLEHVGMNTLSINKSSSGQWNWNQKGEINEVLAGSLFNDLESLKARSVVSETKNHKSLVDFHLIKKTQQISIKFEGHPMESLTLSSPQAGKVYGVYSGKPFIYEFMAAGLKYLNKKASDFVVKKVQTKDGNEKNDKTNPNSSKL